MKSFSIISRHSNKKEGYYLLILDIRAKKVRSLFFARNMLGKAIKQYHMIEQELSEDMSKDVVLVSARSIKELKKAYPNYFADTILFLKNLRSLID